MLCSNNKAVYPSQSREKCSKKFCQWTYALMKFAKNVYVFLKQLVCLWGRKPNVLFFDTRLSICICVRLQQCVLLSFTLFQISPGHEFRPLRWRNAARRLSTVQTSQQLVSKPVRCTSQRPHVMGHRQFRVSDTSPSARHQVTNQKPLASGS